MIAPAKSNVPAVIFIMKRTIRIPASPKTNLRLKESLFCFAMFNIHFLYKVDVTAFSHSGLSVVFYAISFPDKILEDFYKDIRPF
jgi:hypothetical protein